MKHFLIEGAFWITTNTGFFVSIKKFALSTDDDEILALFASDLDDLELKKFLEKELCCEVVKVTSIEEC